MHHITKRFSLPRVASNQSPIILTYIVSILTFCGVICLLTGCETTSSQAGKPPAQSPANIEVFREDAKPTKAYREIGVVKDEGREEEQQEIEKKLIAKAAKMGGNSIIFDKPKMIGTEMGPFSFGQAKLTFLYKGSVVVYQ